LGWKAESGRQEARPRQEKRHTHPCRAKKALAANEGSLGSKKESRTKMGGSRSRSRKMEICALVSSSSQQTPAAGGQSTSSLQPQPLTSLYSTPEAALSSVRDDYLYWTGKLTESSFALSLAVIGANWAVFGSVDKVLNNIWAELSIAAVVLSLVISLIGNGWLGRLLHQRIEYAEQDPTRWRKEFNEIAGTSKYWPSTKRIDDWARFFRLAKILLPVIGGHFFWLRSSFRLKL
jgi:hypothetical protein